MDAFRFEDSEPCFKLGFERCLKNTVCQGTRDVEEGDSRGVQRAEMKAALKLVILPANLPPENVETFQFLTF